jgi:hypothetical protein
MGIRKQGERNITARTSLPALRQDDIFSKEDRMEK